MSHTKGTLIGGRYELLHELGVGAMGAVWAATNVFTDRVVALKLIPHDAVASDELRSRMLREARACGRIQHRNVVEIYDVGQTEDGDPFLVMQLLRGETLEQHVRRVGRLAAQEATPIALQIARALAAAHGTGVVHRDLKPANVFLHREPDETLATVKVLDFGVSKVLAGDPSLATITGSVIGSPAYMSPEQARGASGLDARSDIWAFGAVLFEMLTGHVAFAGETAYAAVAEVLHGRLPRLAEADPSADRRLDAVIAACLQRESERRPDARQLTIELESILTSQPSVAAPIADVAAETVVIHTPAANGAPSATSTTPLLRVSPAPRAEPLRRRARLGLIGAGVASLLLGVGVVASIARRSGEEIPRTRQVPAGTVSTTSASPTSEPSEAALPTANVENVEEIEKPPPSTTPNLPTSAMVAPAKKLVPIKKTAPVRPKPSGPSIPDSPG